VHYSFRSFFAAFGLAFVLLFLTGCAGSVQKTNSGSGSQSGGTLTVSATSLNFQTVTVGQTGTQTLQLTNSGSSAVTVSSLTISAKPFTLSGPAAPVTIQPSATLSYTVSFAPPAAGDDTATLSITSSASSSPLVVNLSGTGSAATSSLVVTPSSVSFGNQPLNTTATQTVTLKNTGSTALTLQTVTLSGAGFGFSGLSQGASLAANQQVSFQVTFDPTVAGAASGSIAFGSPSLSAATTLALSGMGVSGSSAQHSVKLNWNASTTPEVGYIVYRSENSGGPYSPLFGTASDSLTYQDTTVASGTTYYYVVTAVNSSGTESIYSNQVTAVIP
jgi:hypothetical protein